MELDGPVLQHQRRPFSMVHLCPPDLTAAKSGSERSGSGWLSRQRAGIFLERVVDRVSSAPVHQLVFGNRCTWNLDGGRLRLHKSRHILLRQQDAEQQFQPRRFGFRAEWFPASVKDVTIPVPLNPKPYDARICTAVV